MADPYARHIPVYMHEKISGVSIWDCAGSPNNCFQRLLKLSAMQMWQQTPNAYRLTSKKNKKREKVFAVTLHLLRLSGTRWRSTKLLAWRAVSNRDLWHPQGTADKVAQRSFHTCNLVPGVPRFSWESWLVQFITWYVNPTQSFDQICMACIWNLPLWVCKIESITCPDSPKRKDTIVLDFLWG